jgi:hypothetical protein
MSTVLPVGGALSDQLCDGDGEEGGRGVVQSAPDRTSDRLRAVFVACGGPVHTAQDRCGSRCGCTRRIRSSVMGGSGRDLPSKGNSGNKGRGRVGGWLGGWVAGWVSGWVGGSAWVPVDDLPKRCDKIREHCLWPREVFAEVQLFLARLDHTRSCLPS